MGIVDNNYTKYSNGVFACPNCDKRQHAIIRDMVHLTMKLKCKYCGHKWEYVVLSEKEKKERKKIYDKKYREKNRELLNRKRCMYAHTHREKINEYCKARRKEKREERISNPDYTPPRKMLRVLSLYAIR